MLNMLEDDSRAYQAYQELIMYCVNHNCTEACIFYSRDRDACHMYVTGSPAAWTPPPNLYDLSINDD